MTTLGCRAPVAKNLIAQSGLYKSSVQQRLETAAKRVEVEVVMFERFSIFGVERETILYMRRN